MPDTAQKTVNIAGIEWNLPAYTRLGSHVEYTLERIIRAHPEGIALYAAQNLSGLAKQYGGRYKDAFVRFAEVNEHLLEAGLVGPKGGFGYRLTAHAIDLLHRVEATRLAEVLTPRASG